MQTVIPPTWDTQGSKTGNLKKLLMAQSMGFVSHKAKIIKLLEVTSPIINVNGTDVYAPNTQLKHLTGAPYDSAQSELLRNLLGMDDAGLQSVYEASEGTDDLWLKWQHRFGFEKTDFQRALSELSIKIADVATIEIDSTMMSYYIDWEIDNPSYVTPDASGTDKSIYDAELTGFKFQDTSTETLYTKLSDTSGDWDTGVSNTLLVLATANDRVPSSIYSTSNTPLSLEAFIESIFSSRWNGIVITNKEPITRLMPTLTENTTIHKSAITLRNSIGTDITLNYDGALLNALYTMIMLFGTDFMSIDTPLTKISEPIDDFGYSYFVRGKEIFTATILTSFSDDISDTFIDSMTEGIEGSRTFPFVNPVAKVYDALYGRHFWHWRDHNIEYENIEIESNGLFINGGGQEYLTVEGFKRCTKEEYGRWIFALAYIEPTYDDSFLGIGGIVGDLLGGLVTAVAGVLGQVINIFKEIIILILKVTGLYLLLDTIGIESKNIELIAEIGAHIALAIITTGISEYLSLASAGASMAVITLEHVAVLAIDAVFAGAISGVSIEAVASLGLRIASVSMKISSEANKKRVSEEITPEEIDEEARKPSSGGRQSSDGYDYEEQQRQMKYDPFFRLEVKQALNYKSHIAFDNYNKQKRLNERK